MARNRSEAIEWATRQVSNPTRSWYRLCLMFVRMAFGLPGGTPNAGLAWDWAKHKHPTTDPLVIPAGVPVFWETPGVADHVALSLGNGKCLSNDFKRHGMIDVVSIDAITRGWNCRLLGWTEDLNGVRVWKAPARPWVSLGTLQRAARTDPKAPQNHRTAPREVRLVEVALKAEGLLPRRYALDGHFGSSTIDGYAGWQRRLGYRGDAADGIPGLMSLRSLGERHGFDVRK